MVSKYLIKLIARNYSLKILPCVILSFISPVNAEKILIDKDHPLTITGNSIIATNGENNSIELISYDGLIVSSNLYGINVSQQNIINNTFYIKAKDENDDWFGGTKLTGFYTSGDDYSAINNIFTLTSGKYEFNKYNGITGINIFNGQSLNQNTVEINDVQLKGYLIGCEGSSLTNAIGNELIINSGVYSTVSYLTANKGIYGVYLSLKQDATSQAISNKVTINNGSFDISEISVLNLDTESKIQKIENNILTINNGQFNHEGTSIYSIKGNVDVNAKHNGVIINGGIFNTTTTVYAIGYVSGENSDNFIAVNAKNNLDLSQVNLYGATNKYASTLYINGANNLQIRQIQKFNKLILKDIAWQTYNPAIDVTYEAYFKEIAIDESSGFTLAPNQKITKGDSMTLIHAPLFSSSLNINSGNTDTVYTQANVAYDIEGKIVQNGENIDFVVTGLNLSEQTHLINENRAVTVAFLNAGSDMALNALNIPKNTNSLTTFISTEGYASSYDVNNNLKINGFHQAIGFHGLTELNNTNELRLAVYFEHGEGNYRTFNQQNNEFFRGDGEVEYLGGTIAGRYTFKNNFYFDASLRLGKLETKMDNAVRSSQGNFLGYETRSDYFGAHLGLGKTFIKTNKYELDLYSRLYFTKVKDDEFNLGGDNFYFDNVTSQRLKLGTQIRSPEFGLYADIAYEYEFDGKANMQVAEFSAPRESLKGGTFSSSLGLNYNFTSTPLWIDLKLSGFSGEHNGIGGKFLIAYEI